MTTIATLGPESSLDWEAARRYDPKAELVAYPQISAVLSAFAQKKADLAVIPVYNTRDGERKEFFRALADLGQGYWIDNLVLPVELALGSLDARSRLELIIGEPQHLQQCSEFLTENFPDTSLMATHNLENDLNVITGEGQTGRGVIAPEELLAARKLKVRQRDVAPYNRTRYAVLGREPLPATGYDATVLTTAPLKDRVGLLYDILGEFSRRGVSLLDMRTEGDLKTQQLLFHVEVEGHRDDQRIQLALERIENHIIQEPGAIRILGSFPRVDMRTKLIGSAGFIGTGEMSKWFAKRLENEGYKVLLSGRTSELTPEEMIDRVQVVLVCVPISATAAAIEKYGPLLKEGQALVIMAGEAENTIETALQSCAPEVEVMLVHNLWGPQAATMKDKNVTVVRTGRSGPLCSEIESFLYKHGAQISRDNAVQHDLMMGVSQKLPTAISVALALTLRDNRIPPGEIGGHSTLTSLYGILAMCRIHAQNPRTYGEILSTKGAGRKIVRDFARNLEAVLDLAESEDIEELGKIINESRSYLTEDFLQDRMKQALAVDETLGRVIKND